MYNDFTHALTLTQHLPPSPPPPPFPPSPVVSNQVVNVNDCLTLSDYPPGDTQAYGSAEGGLYATSNDKGTGLLLTAPTGDGMPEPVPYVWGVSAVGVEASAFLHWDQPSYQPPDEVRNFGLWLSDRKDRDVDFVKVLFYCVFLKQKRVSCT